MLRPTHFVLLFAVLLCAYAAPAEREHEPAVAQADAAEQPKPQAEVVPSLKTGIPHLGQIAPSGPNAGPPPGRPIPGPEDGGPVDEDLDTDATSHWGYTTYYGPRWGWYGWGGRGWGGYYGGHGWNGHWRTNYWW